MDMEAFKPIVPVAKEWIETILATYAHQAIPVTSFGFSRLPQYYPAEFLQNTKVVLLPHVPVPPLSKWGLHGQVFLDFEKSDPFGITYKDTYFLRESEFKKESLHFHELVHVIQWGHLGADRFLLNYAVGLDQYGYEDSPLEAMAFGLETVFKQNKTVFQVEPVVCQKLNQLFG